MTRKLIFRSRDQGVVTLTILRGPKPDTDALGEGKAVPFSSSGIDLQDRLGLIPQQGFLANQQHIQLTYQRGEKPILPPFKFQLITHTAQDLPTLALEEGVYQAHIQLYRQLGPLSFCLRDGKERIIWQMKTEINPTHLPYKKARKYMFSQLENWLKGLAIATAKGQYVKYHTANWITPSSSSPLFFQEDIESFLQATAQLSQKLQAESKKEKKSLSPHSPIHDAHKILRIEENRTLVEFSKQTQDIPLNRWVKASIRRLLLKWEKSDSYQEEAQQLYKSLSLDFNGITEGNQPFHPAHLPPIYRRWYQLYLKVYYPSQIEEFSLFKLPVKEMPLLYEYWAFLKVASMIQQMVGQELTFQDILTVREEHISTHLTYPQQTQIVFQGREGKTSVTLWYQRAAKTPLGLQRPDLWLEITKEGIDIPFMFFFDIKYQLVKGKEGQFSVSKEAINQLHRYRDAIKPSMKLIQGQAYYQKAFGAAVLFPYPKDEATFYSHPQFQGLRTEGIGALPLNPDPYAQHTALKRLLTELIQASANTLFEKTVLYDTRPYQLNQLAFREWKPLSLAEFPILHHHTFPDMAPKGAIDAMLKYQRADLVWLRTFQEFRAWQEGWKYDEQTYCNEAGIHISWNGAIYSIQEQGDHLQINRDGQSWVYPIDQSIPSIFEQLFTT
ncbi:MAG: nuclease domain-containing protein [Bacteroidota bacterium]